DQVDVIEGHGTGTTLGDPIEVQALLATYGRARSAQRPLWLGSIKSNIGHTQAASGAAGIIKMVMALQEGLLPPTLHVDEPSRQVDWSTGGVSLLTKALDWPAGDEPRRAGVSSFGVGGTNAHVILEEAPEPVNVKRRAGSAPESLAVEGLPDEGSDGYRQTGETDTGTSSGGGPSELPVIPWVISAKGEDALCEQAARLLERVNGEQTLSPLDIGLSLSAGRAALLDRAVVLGDDLPTLSAGVSALAGRGEAPSLVRGAVDARGSCLALLFTGQGAQRAGMGRGLYELFPVFREALRDACGCLDVELGRPLLEVVLGTGDREPSEAPSGEGLLDQTMFTQAGLFALEVALFRLLESWAVKPDFLLGHSIGELAAVHVAGALSLEDACALVAARGRLMGALPPGGAMVALQASEREARELIAGSADSVSLAAVNGPSSVVISGDEDPVLELAGRWERDGHKVKRLRVSHAFHSPRMDGMLEQLAELASGLSFAQPTIPIISNLTGEPLSLEQMRDPHYWANHAREAVRFADGVSWLASHGTRSFLELGPDGVLSAMARECLVHDEHDEDCVVVAPLLRGGHPEERTLLGALARAWVNGVELDWAAMYENTGAERVQLPAYAFQRRRYWLDTLATGKHQAGSAAGMRPLDHPLLHAAITLAGDGRSAFTGCLSLAEQPWLGEHVVAGVALVPGTTFVEMALYAGSELGCEVLRELVMEAPLVLEEGLAIEVQVVMGEPLDEGERTVSIHSRPRGALEEDAAEARPWTRHASGVLVPGAGAPYEPPALAGEAWTTPDAHSLDVRDMYERFGQLGVDYGESFMGVRAAWRRGEQMFAEVRLPEQARAEGGRFGIHPALLDAAFQAMGGLAESRDEREPAHELMIPFAWSGVRLHAEGAHDLRVRGTLSAERGASLFAADGAGVPVVSIESLKVRPVTPAQLWSARAGHREAMFGLDWLPAKDEGEHTDGMLALLGEGHEHDGYGNDGHENDLHGHDEHKGLAGALREAGAFAGVFADAGALADSLEQLDGPVAAVLADFTELPTPEAHTSGGTPPADSVPAGAHAVAHRALATIQAWLAEERFSNSRLVLVTRNAVGASAQDRVIGLQAAPVWGL
ncbi:MAG TPA: type I polyketide synthase, partial [Solirubrobacteraceae bacterium]